MTIGRRPPGQPMLITGSPGRRVRSFGASRATGDVLLFLHADTHLPGGFEEHVRSVLSIEGVVAGAFGLRIDAPQRVFRTIERVVNWRSRRLSLPYGDQAIFMNADTFKRTGGFPDASAMEDFELVRRLRRLGRIGLADAAVSTSARRWLDHGIVRTTMLNQLCIAAYLAGVSPDRIAGWRQETALTTRPPAADSLSVSPRSI